MLITRDILTLTNPGLLLSNEGYNPSSSASLPGSGPLLVGNTIPVAKSILSLSFLQPRSVKKQGLGCIS